MSNGRGFTHPASAQLLQKESSVCLARLRRMRRRLLRWYRTNARPWPWRATRDSYRIWVAEVMLQQTRVEVVAKAYAAFVHRFPTLEALASASEEEVLAAWSGLGYYSRARNLHRAARWLVAHGHSAFPRDEALARQLPGVGAYTAAAVLSIAYGLPCAAIDANVKRVLRRWTGHGAGASDDRWRAVARALLPARAPGDWNQALMELGQRVCTAQAPKCGACPVALYCEAANNVGSIARRTASRQGTQAEVILVDAFWVTDGGQRTIVERGAFPFLRHLWLPLLEVGGNGTGAARSHLPARVCVGEFRHAIVRRRFRVRVFAARASQRTLRTLLARAPAGAERRLVTTDELERLGRSSILLKAWHLWERHQKSK